MARLTRRKFLQTSAAASTAFSLFTIAGTKASGRVLGANDTIRVGVAGINGRGKSHIDAFRRDAERRQRADHLPDRSRYAAVRLADEDDLFARHERADVRGRHPQGDSTTKISTPCRWPPAITGTR